MENKIHHVLYMHVVAGVCSSLVAEIRISTNVIHGSNMGQTHQPSRCSQFDTGPKTDIYPYSHRPLCTAQGTCCVKNMI